MNVEAGTMERLASAKARIDRKIVAAMSKRYGWTAEQTARAEAAINNAPAAIYTGDKMYPVDLHGIGLKAAQQTRGN